VFWPVFLFAALLPPHHTAQHAARLYEKGSLVIETREWYNDTRGAFYDPAREAGGARAPVHPAKPMRVQHPLAVQKTALPNPLERNDIPAAEA